VGGTPATGATVALRRAALRELLPVPDGWPHDEWLALGISMRGRVDCLEWPSISYRQHGGNQIGVRRRSLVEKAVGNGRPDKRLYMRQLVDRLVAMREWAEMRGVELPADRLGDIEERLRHVRCRASLPRRFGDRFAMVAAEFASGRYGRYSRGLRSILSDLMDMN
jgi:hypothetical protein